jgi:hypothetical protein
MAGPLLPVQEKCLSQGVNSDLRKYFESTGRLAGSEHVPASLLFFAEYLCSLFRIFAEIKSDHYVRAQRDQKGDYSCPGRDETAG